MFSRCPYNMVNFGPLAAEICWRVWGTPLFQRVSRLGSVTARQSSSGHQPNFAALNRGRHLCSAGRPSHWALAHILVSSCGFFFLLPIFYFLFIAYSQPSQMGCLPYFHAWCGLSANLGCRSETCCTRLDGNAGPKKPPKMRHLGTIAQFVAISSQLMHTSTSGKKIV